MIYPCNRIVDCSKKKRAYSHIGDSDLLIGKEPKFLLCLVVVTWVFKGVNVQQALHLKFKLVVHFTVFML